MKKKQLLILALLLAATTVLAVWTIYTQSSYTARVVSPETSPLVFSIDFSDYVLNTTTDAAVDNTTASVTNENGDLNLTVGLDIVKIDAPDNCVDYVTDCSHSLTWTGGALNDGDTIVLGYGVTNFTSEVSCVKLSCPQNISVTFNLTET